MSATILPARVTTTVSSRAGGPVAGCGFPAATSSASKLPSGLGYADSWIVVPRGQPSALMSAAAVTMVRGACPGLSSSMALSGADCGPLHSNWDWEDAADVLAGADTRAPSDSG